MERIKLFILNHKYLLIIPIIIISLIVLYFGYFFNERKEEPLLISNNLLTTSEYVKVETISEYVSVDIKGRVKKPGVYQFDKMLDRRVIDVIKQAGGLLTDADTVVTNLSKKIFDEMVIIIFSKEEVKNFVKVEEELIIKTDKCKEKENDSCIDNDSNKNNGLININTASKEELMNIPGIGESKALAIIEYRKTYKFNKIEDIMNVSGIGESVYNNLKAYITV